jgi:hypothetical protein
MRWKIETFHKILKLGSKAEDVRLRAIERIVNLIAILCLLSWRIFWMTMLPVDPIPSFREIALCGMEHRQHQCGIQLLFGDRSENQDAPIAELKNGLAHVPLLIPDLDSVQTLDPNLSHLVVDGVLSLSRSFESVSRRVS